MYDIYIYICVYVCVYTYIYIYMCVCVCVCVILQHTVFSRVSMGCLVGNTCRGGFNWNKLMRKSMHLVCISHSCLLMFMEIITVCSQIHTKHTNTPCGQNVALYIYIYEDPVRTAQ